MKRVLLYTGGKSGIDPVNQDEKYWKDNGYPFVAFETEGAITLSKKPITLEYHAAYSLDSIYKKPNKVTMEVVKEEEKIVIITPRGREVDRIRKAQRVINNNLDTNIDELNGPLCEILGIENNKAAKSFIFEIICNFDTEENLAKQLTNN